MNKVILSGNLCRDIELGTIPNGRNYVMNCVAVRRDFKNANGEYDSDFINIVAWETQAKYLSEYAQKGDRVELVGRWQNRQYTDQMGTQRTINEVVVESITAFTKQPTQQHPNKNAEFEVDEQDLPF